MLELEIIVMLVCLRSETYLLYINLSLLGFHLFGMLLLLI